MELSLNTFLLSTACLFGILSIAILSYHSFTRKFYAVPLVLNLIFTTMWVFHRLLLETGLILEFPHVFRIFTPFGILAGPTVYLYVRGLLKNDTGWKKTDWLFMIPGAVVAIPLIPFYLKSAREKYEWLLNLYAEPDRFAQFFESILPPYFQHIVNAIIVIVFGVMAIALILKYLKEAEDRKTRTIRQGTINWIIFHSGVIIVLGSTGLSAVFIENYTQIHFFSVLNSLAAVLEISLFLLLYFNPAILYGIPNHVFKEYDQNSEESDKVSYGLTEEKIRHIKQQLHDYLVSTQPYLKQDFNSDNLAEALGISRHQLSFVINNEFHINFHGFVNRLRIDYCLKNIQPSDWETLSIDGIAQSIGYKNRGTFSRAFKYHTGMFPSEYRKSILIDSKPIE